MLGDILIWAFRYLIVALLTYLFAAYVDLVQGPRVKFRGNLLVAGLWPIYWGWVLWIKLRRFRGMR